MNAAGVGVVQPTPDKLELLAGAGSMFQVHSFISGRKLTLDGRRVFLITSCLWAPVCLVSTVDHVKGTNW